MKHFDVSAFSFTEEQEDAAFYIILWLQNCSPHIHYLVAHRRANPLGAVMHLARAMGSGVRFAAGTEAGAAELRRVGVPGATSVARLIYDHRIRRDGSGELRLKPRSALEGTEIIVLADVTGLSAQMVQDLLSFGVHLVVLRDPWDVPGREATVWADYPAPAKELRSWMGHRNDPHPGLGAEAALHELHPLTPGVFPNLLIRRMPDLEDADFRWADAVFVHDRSRIKDFNIQLRELRGAKSVAPLVGDVLYCPRTALERGLVRGERYEVLGVKQISPKVFSLRICLADASRSKAQIVQVHVDRLVDPFRRRGGAAAELDCIGYSYALPMSEAHAGRWKRTLVLNDFYDGSRRTARTLYAAVGRATEHLGIGLIPS